MPTTRSTRRQGDRGRAPFMIEHGDSRFREDYRTLAEAFDNFARRASDDKQLRIYISSHDPENEREREVWVRGTDLVMSKALCSTRSWFDVTIEFSGPRLMSSSECVWNVGPMPIIDDLELSYPTDPRPGRTTFSAIDLTQSVCLRRLYLCGEFVIQWNMSQPFQNLHTLEFDYHVGQTRFPTLRGTLEFLRCTPNLQHLTLHMDRGGQIYIPDNTPGVYLPYVRNFHIDVQGEGDPVIANFLKFITLPALEHFRLQNVCLSLPYHWSLDANANNHATIYGLPDFLNRSGCSLSCLTIETDVVSLNELVTVLTGPSCKYLRSLTLVRAMLVGGIFDFLNACVPPPAGPALLFCKRLERVDFDRVDLLGTPEIVASAERFLELRWRHNPRYLKQARFSNCGLKDGFEESYVISQMEMEGFELDLKGED